jgi:hypothetical protein
MYRPVTTLSYLFNSAILGNSNHPAGYHWVNFFLHGVNVLFVFALRLRLLAGRARAFRTAFFMALLWSLHPVLTESVTNIVSRTCCPPRRCSAASDVSEECRERGMAPHPVARGRGGGRCGRRFLQSALWRPSRQDLRARAIRRFSASRATKFPSLPRANTRPEAVVRTPLSV